jgi:trigger factor
VSNQTQETNEMENPVQAAATAEHSTDQQFQNDRVRVEVTRKPGCIARLVVEMTPEAVKDAYEKAVRAVKKEVSIPGFRKGKVPEDIVKHNFASAIAKEHKDTVLQLAFNESLTLTGLSLFSRNSLRRSELKKCSMETGASAVFEFETAPDVPKIDIQAIQMRPVEPRTISEKHMEMSYRHLQLMHATWEEVSDKAVELGDFVELDIDVTQHPAHNVCINQLFWIEEGESPRWIIDTVIGMQLDESRETVAAPQPDDPPYPIVYEENQPHKECRITLKKIKKAILPEETDAFAQSCGAPSVDVLKKRIADQIVHEETEYTKELNRYNLRRELIEKYHFDLPESLVNAEVRERMTNIKKGADLLKGSLPTDTSKEAQTKATVEAETRGFFTWMFLVQPFVKEANVAVSHEELEAELNKQMRFPRDKRLVYPDLHPDDIRNRLFMLVMMRKCEDYFLSKLAA